MEELLIAEGCIRLQKSGVAVGRLQHSLSLKVGTGLTQEAGGVGGRVVRLRATTNAYFSVSEST